MYNIKIGEEVYTVASPRWRREITGGGISIIISCLEKDAHGIWFEGIDYHIKGLRSFEYHELETVEVEKVKDSFVLSEPETTEVEQLKTQVNNLNMEILEITKTLTQIRVDS